MTKDINFNNTYYANLDENFNNAISLFEREISQDELLKMLEDGNIVQKQISALKLSEINSVKEAQILTKNLVGQDGKIREAVSLKINELIQNPQFASYFHNKTIYDTFLEAVIDVNSNVCRNILSAISIFKTNSEFCSYFTQNLITLTNKLADKVSKFNFQDGKYKVNKEVFKLYWCLEAIFEFADFIKIEILKEIIKKTKDIDEYTIREKTAKILTKNFDDEYLKSVKSDLKNDKNYYVRRF